MSEITQSDTLVRASDCGTMFSRTMWLRVIGSQSGLPSRSSRQPVRLRPFGLRRDSLARFASEGWWSQTGSNRRPHACKARALPAELWPRNQKTNASRGMVVKTESSHARSSPLRASPGTLRSTLSVAVPRGAEGEAWWAWEDLNFRPHAYQARALTN